MNNIYDYNTKSISVTLLKALFIEKKESLALGVFDKVDFIILHFLNAFYDVIYSTMSQALFRPRLANLVVPSNAQVFEGRHVNNFIGEEIY